MEELLRSFSKLFVPEDILAHFEVKTLKEVDGVILIEMDEKIEGHVPKIILREGKAVLSGYCNPKEIQTYPAQGKEVFIKLRRRKWKIKGTTKSYSNSYRFTKEGMKATDQFGSFLKEIGRE